MIHLAPAARETLIGRIEAREPTILAIPRVGAWELAFALPLIFPETRMHLTISCLSDGKPGRARSRFGVHPLRPADGLLEAIRTLRENGIHGVVFDQLQTRQGMQTLLMDRLTAVSELPGVLVEHFQARLVGLYQERISFWHYALRFQEIATPARAAPVSVNLNRWLEHLLRTSDSACGSWAWGEDRWRPPPSSRQMLCLDRSRPLAPDDADLPRGWRIWIRLPEDLGRTLRVVPLIRALRRSRPDAGITLIGRRPLLDLLEPAGLAESMIPIPARRLNLRPFVRLQSAHPDLYLVFEESKRSDAEAWLTGCSIRIGMERDGDCRPLLTTSWNPPDNLDERKLHETRLLESFLRHFGLDNCADCSPLALARPGGPGKEEPDPDIRMVGLLCGPTDDPADQWPTEHWKALADGLLREHPDVHLVLFGAPRHQASIDYVEGDVPAERTTRLIAEPENRRFASALAACDLVIAQASGGLHLANALGVPVIGLYGPANPVQTGPVFEAPCRILLPPGSRPTGGRPIAGISVETVLEAADRSLRRRAAAPFAA